MTRSELIEKISGRLPLLPAKDIEMAIKTILEQMIHTLSSGDRIEVRGFGSFTLHHRAQRIGRNPRTGEVVNVPARYSPHFKPGKELRERVDRAKNRRSD